MEKDKVLVILTAIILLITGIILYVVFDNLGMDKNKKGSYINYNVNDYVEIVPVLFNDYNNVYSSINVSKINIKNIDERLVSDFIKREEEIIEYITEYYEEINVDSNYVPVSNVYSTIKTQINGAILSILYKVDFNLDENVFSNNIKSYVTVLNVDLGTNKVLSKEELLSKYNYSKEYISDKLFDEDVLIQKGQIVIDKDTNISLTKSDVERKKENYVGRIILQFDNIIDMYIENNSLVLVYDTKELKSICFDNEFDTDVKFRYLK